MSDVLAIDGSYGEGGGQILRTALALSTVLRRPVELNRIRAGRKKPGLQPQHLACVKALAEISGAEVHGAEIGSSRLYFAPGAINGGSRRIDVGTAGSVSLVFQAVLAPLAFAATPSTVTMTGGTHVPWSPPAFYISEVFLPMAERMGLGATWRLRRGGFYPKGGGEVQAAVRPLTGLRAIDLTNRGALLALRGISAVAGLPRRIAERQMSRVQDRLADAGDRVEVEMADLDAATPGDVVFLWAEFERTRVGFGALGQRGKPAERVADEAVDAMLDFLAGDAGTDAHLADQLAVLMALADGRSDLTTACVSQHLLTNVWTIRQFLPIAVSLHGRLGEPGRLTINGAGLHVSSCAETAAARTCRQGAQMVRQAKTADIQAIVGLINAYAAKGDLLPLTILELSGRIDDFHVYEQDGQVAGVCSLFVYGPDLAEIRSLAVRPAHQGKGIGRMVTEACIASARQRGIKRVFALTYASAFFERLGFHVVDKLTLPEKVWKDCLQCSKLLHCDETAVLRDLSAG